MKQQRKVFHSRRVWLNPDGHGHILTNITGIVQDFKVVKRGFRKTTTRGDLEVVFDIADCSRIVSLDFSLWGVKRKEIRKMRRKAELLRKEVNDWTDAYLDALNWLEQQKDKEG